MVLSFISEQVELEIEIFLMGLSGQLVDILQGVGIMGIFLMLDGEILIIIIGNWMELIFGKIYCLKCVVDVFDLLVKLLELGVFVDFIILMFIVGIIFYEI